MTTDWPQMLRRAGLLVRWQLARASRSTSPAIDAGSADRGSTSAEELQSQWEEKRAAFRSDYRNKQKQSRRSARQQQHSGRRGGGGGGRK